MPPSEPSPAWALSAYPISDLYRGRLEGWIGRPVQVLVLSELRRNGVVETLRQLLLARHEACYVLLQDASSHPIAPALRLMASFTRCRRLLMVDADGRIDVFGRASGLFGVPRLMAGSIRGAIAALRCWIELRALVRERRAPRRLRGVARGLYLKTNLWFGVKAGGSVGHVAGVANALARRARTLDLFSVEEPPLLDPSVRFHPVRHAGVFGYPFELNYYVYQRAFVDAAKRVIGDGGADFVYQRLSLANYSGLRLARELRVPLVLEYNGSEVWVARNWGRALKLPTLAAMAEDAMIGHADLIVAVSDVLGDELSARGVPPERVLVHPNCVDPDRFDPGRFGRQDALAVRAAYGIPADALVCGFIGTFGQWHGVTVLADAIAELARSAPEWLRAHRVHFLLIGDGLHMPYVRATVSPADVAPFVTLTGLVEQDRAPAMLSACDILLSPHVPNPDGSRFFGSPTKLFEYMAMGKPIVASDLDQIGEVLRPGLRPDADDEALAARSAMAVLVRPGDRADFIRGLRWIVERPPLWGSLGANARQRVLERYTWQRNVDEVLLRLQALG